MSEHSSPKLLVASWNILSDHMSSIYPAQRARVGDLTDALTHIDGTDRPDVLFCCEGLDDRIIGKIAVGTDLELAGEPVNYAPHEWMAFMVRPDLASEAQVEFAKFGHLANKSGFLTMHLAGLTFVGVHYPYKPLKDLRNRELASRQVLEHVGDEPAVIMGDFNSLFFNDARRQFIRAGFKEVHFLRRPKFPEKSFHGLVVPRYLPRYNLDAIYISPDVLIEKASYAYSSASDHPLLYAKLVIPK
jgi:hypothetical protein